MGKLNDSIGVVRTGLEVSLHLATAEQKEMLADAKNALADLKSEMAELKEENSKLKETLVKKDDFSLDKGVKWKKDDINKDQPFCPVCFANGTEIPLQKDWDGADKTQTLWHCPQQTCGATFNPWDYKEPDPEPQSWAPWGV